ncbi:hypothetical protein [Chryseobacterium sp. MMS23-Vi53]|uniref:hypothetical protein n=1 Tax=Chryseobacterium sp. MMS23-Vi53 TaxID=3386644 RepID=UPI0039ED3CC6
MIKKLFPAFLLVGTFTFAQVGINTASANASLHVVGNPTDTTKYDGIIAPRITGEQLRAKIYTSAQDGALVYATLADTAPAGQTIDVVSPGYYYYSGSLEKWVKLITSTDKKIRTLNNGIIANDDFTLLLNGDVSLPTATISNQGKIYNLINDTTGTVTINGTFRINGGNFSNYGLNNSNMGRGIVVQSTGTAWSVISRY